MIRENRQLEDYGESVYVGELGKRVDNEVCKNIEQMKRENKKLIENLKL